MTRPPDSRDAARVRRAKAAARETIGKLIGDDAEVREGRAEQKAARTTGAARPSKEQE